MNNYQAEKAAGRMSVELSNGELYLDTKDDDGEVIDHQPISIEQLDAAIEDHGAYVADCIAALGDAEAVLAAE